MHQENTKTILASSIPQSGHTIPLFRICKFLQSKGYRVAYASSEFWVNSLKQEFPKFEYIPIKDGFQEILGKQKKLPTKLFLSEWSTQIKKAVQIYKPDIILADFFTYAPMDVAEEMKIKLVINVPGPLEIAKAYGIANFQGSFSFMGFTVAAPRILYQIMRKYSMPEAFVSAEFMTRNITLFNSFFGLEKAIVLPPNIKPVGAILDKQNNFRQLDSDLASWLQRTRQKKLSIIYVSFGSLVKMSERFIFRLYQGLKSTELAILWSLKNSPITQKNDNLFIRGWLPQVQLLNLPQVKVVVSHCGWGGVTQCIYAKKPILAVPCFGDQMANAEIVEQSGIGLILRRPGQLNVLPSVVIDDPDYTIQDFNKKIGRLLHDQSFKKKVNKLRILSDQAGGLQTVYQQIQNIIEGGVEHLIDPEMEKCQGRGVIGFLKYFSIVLLLILIVLLIVFLVKR